jgi:hypothetical protein
VLTALVFRSAGLADDDPAIAWLILATGRGSEESVDVSRGVLDECAPASLSWSSVGVCVNNVAGSVMVIVPSSLKMFDEGMIGGLASRFCYGVETAARP